MHCRSRASIQFEAEDIGAWASVRTFGVVTLALCNDRKPAQSEGKGECLRNAIVYVEPPEGYMPLLGPASRSDWPTCNV